MGLTCLNQPYVAHVFQMLMPGESKVKKHGWGQEQQICRCLIPGARHPHPPNPKPSNTRGQQDAAELCDFGTTFHPPNPSYKIFPTYYGIPQWNMYVNIYIYIYRSMQMHICIYIYMHMYAGLGGFYYWGEGIIL